MRGYRGIGKIVVPALIVFVMVMGAFGTLISPRGSPDTTGGQTQTPSTRAGSVPSALSGPGTGPAGDSNGGVSGDRVSSGMIVNKDIAGRTDIRHEPLAMQYDPTSGRAWDQDRQVLTLPDAAIPKDQAVSFTSRVAPMSTVLRSDPAPTAASVDAGGPYGGPTTFEGDSIEFTATVDDPNLIFFRWDFNGDGEWDTGDAASGNWVPDTTVTYQYLDMYNGLAKVEAWDGVSTMTVSYTGWPLGMASSPEWWLLAYVYTYTVGWMFTAQTTMTVDTVAFFRYSDGESYGKWVTIWDGSTQAKLAECEPGPGSYTWTSCALASPITLQEGQDYVISNTIYSPDFGYWYTYGLNTPADTDQVAFGATYYMYGYSEPAFPAYYWYDQFVPMVDFYFSYDVVFPLTVADTAFVEVNNVAPVVFDLQANPNVVQEGSVAVFSAMFYDPGLAEQWQYRWCYGDGTCDDWGGIKVGSGLSQLANILVYSDVAPHYAAQALDFFGVTYTFTSDIFSLPTVLDSKHWDLIIYQSYYIAYIAPIIEDSMLIQAKAGALLMYNNWYAMQRVGHPLMAYFGGAPMSGYTTPLTMYAWEPTNDLFNSPTQVPLQLDPTHNQYYTDGQKIKVLSNAFDPMGYSVNRQTSNAAMVVRNDLTSIWNGFTPQNYQGDQNYDGDPDMIELLVNEIRLLTGPEIPRSMPWPVPGAKHAFRDDDPTTGTPSDIFTATLEVKDSNDNKLKGGSVDALTDFESGSPWPTGWSETEGFAWYRGYSYYVNPTQAALWWYYDDWDELVHRLQSQAYDLSVVDLSAPTVRVTLSYDHYWWADYSAYDPYAYQDGYVEVSADNFATSTLLAEYHDMDPATDQGTRSFDISQFAGSANVRVRFTIQGYDDWLWHVDNVYLYAEWGERVNGLGTGDTTIQVDNVAPTVYGGPTSGVAGEAVPFDFNGFKIDDPTLWNPTSHAWDPVSTEWFAYRWNFDDGTMSDWTYAGSLELPKLKVLLIHTLSFGSGSGFISLLKGIDLVSQLDDVDFLYLSPDSLPSLDTMLGYDLIVFVTNYAIFSSTFDLARVTIGDRLADYMDLTGRGVITMMATYDNSPYYGELFTLLGRYIDEQYGSFEKATYGFEPGTLGEIVQPGHPVMQGVQRLTSPYIHSGDYPLTPGAELLAKWDDGNAAIAVKELGNGARSVNIGGFSGQDSAVCGGDCATLLRNAIIWTSRVVVPTNDIPSFSHVYGDNGLYDADLMLIDDDMGWIWDAASNEPMPLQGFAQDMTHFMIPIQINNVDPTIDTKSVEAFIAADVCLRVSGDSWSTVSLSFFTDGVQSGGASVVRTPGSPNDQAKCTFAKIDVLSSHVFSTQVDYAPAQGDTSGTNDWWVIIAPWRDPITPGHGTVTYKSQSKVEDPSTYTTTIAMPTLKMDLLDSGRGAPIEVAATASDSGTDDLGFVWVWGDGAPDTANVHNNADGTVTAGTVGDPWYVGFSEPFFDLATNTGRSPDGTAPFTARDFATHHFTAVYPRMWVVLIVLDDDNTRGYSSDFLHDGTDMELLVFDLT